MCFHSRIRRPTLTTLEDQSLPVTLPHGNSGSPVMPSFKFPCKHSGVLYPIGCVIKCFLIPASSNAAFMIRTVSMHTSGSKKQLTPTLTDSPFKSPDRGWYMCLFKLVFVDKQVERTGSWGSLEPGIRISFVDLLHAQLGVLMLSYSVQTTCIAFFLYRNAWEDTYLISFSDFNTKYLF